MPAVGILGGSFDPIHIGHLITAQVLLEKRNLSKIFFVPCFISPHKIKKGDSMPHHRLAMVNLAIEHNAIYELCDFELTRQGISYTVDTIKEIKQTYDDVELIIGFDNILKFDTWKNPDEIFRLAKVIVMKRPSSVEPDVQDKYYKQAVFVDTPLLEISSSDIRERIRNNKTIDFYTPEKVKEYIYKNKLYSKD